MSLAVQNLLAVGVPAAWLESPVEVGQKEEAGAGILNWSGNACAGKGQPMGEAGCKSPTGISCDLSETTM